MITLCIWLFLHNNTHLMSFYSVTIPLIWCCILSCHLEGPSFVHSFAEEHFSCSSRSWQLCTKRPCLCARIHLNVKFSLLGQMLKTDGLRAKNVVFCSAVIPIPTMVGEHSYCSTFPSALSDVISPSLQLVFVSLLFWGNAASHVPDQGRLCFLLCYPLGAV